MLCTLAGLLAVLGHSKSVWLGFSGGKSAATGLGVLLALAWPVGLGVAAVFATVVGISKTVSVGSISAALSAFRVYAADAATTALCFTGILGWLLRGVSAPQQYFSADVRHRAKDVWQLMTDYCASRLAIHR